MDKSTTSSFKVWHFPGGTGSFHTFAASPLLYSGLEEMQAIADVLRTGFGQGKWRQQCVSSLSSIDVSAAINCRSGHHIWGRCPPSPGIWEPCRIKSEGSEQGCFDLEEHMNEQRPRGPVSVSGRDVSIVAQIRARTRGRQMLAHVRKNLQQLELKMESQDLKQTPSRLASEFPTD